MRRDLNTSLELLFKVVKSHSIVRQEEKACQKRQEDQTIVVKFVSISHGLLREIEI